MILGNPLYQDWTYVISGSVAGAAWVDAVNDPPRLHDRSAKLGAKFTWIPGTQFPTSYVKISATRAAGFIPRGAAILGMTGIPEGTMLRINGVNAATSAYVALGGNTTTQRAVKFPDGKIGAKWVFDSTGIPACKGYEVTIFNDVNGVASIPAGSSCSVGEIIFPPCIYMQHEVGWKQGRDTTGRKFIRTQGGEVFFVKRQSYRKLSLRPIFDTDTAARGQGLANSMDYEKLLAQLADDPFCLVFDNFDTAAIIQRSGMLAVCTNFSDISKLQGNYYQFDTFDFEEIPS